MPAEAWALGGVVVGALLGTIGQIVNAALQRKWATDDRAADAKQRSDDARLSAFSEVFESIGYLTSELAKSGIREYGEWEETGPNSKHKSQVNNAEHAVDPGALRQFVAAVSKLRLFTKDSVLDVEALVRELNLYVSTWADLDFREEPDPLIERLTVLSKSIGDLYRQGQS